MQCNSFPASFLSWIPVKQWLHRLSFTPSCIMFHVNFIMEKITSSEICSLGLLWYWSDKLALVFCILHCVWYMNRKHMLTLQQLVTGLYHIYITSSCLSRLNWLYTRENSDSAALSWLGSATLFPLSSVLRAGCFRSGEGLQFEGIT